MFNIQEHQMGKEAEENARLYGNDKGANPDAFKTEETIIENEGLYGEDDGLSAEEKIYQNLDHGISDETGAFEIGKQCDDYLNNKGKMPAGLNESEARELAIMYRESLGEENQEETKKVAVKIQRRLTEMVNLKPGQIAHATPNPSEKVQLNRRQNNEPIRKDNVAA